MILSERFHRMRTRRRLKQIDAVCHGWSGKTHWQFFHSELAKREIRDICILGVYQGRDIAYMRDALREQHRSDFRIVGVDLFDDVPGADWPDDNRDLSWEEAGFGEAPTLERAQANLTQLGLDLGVELHKGSAMDYLTEHPESFDLIYIDIHTTTSQREM